MERILLNTLLTELDRSTMTKKNVALVYKVQQMYEEYRRSDSQWYIDKLASTFENGERSVQERYTLAMLHIEREQKAMIDYFNKHNV